MSARLILYLAAIIPVCPQANAQPSAKGQSGTQVSAQSAILGAFRNDISVCHSITKVLNADRAFIASFIPYVNRVSKPLEMFLLQSPNSSSTEFQYVLRNQAYLDIDVSPHGHAFAVAWVENEGIYCAPTLARLDAIEALGESQEAWTIRKFFLDKALQSLEHPSDEMTTGTIDFESFKSFVLKADGRYMRTQRSKFLAWTWAAVETIESSRKRIEAGAAGRSTGEQNGMLDDRIMFLRSFANR